MTLNTCSGCGKTVSGHEITHFGSQDTGYRLLCSQCFNKEVASLHGMEDFEDVQFEPIGLTDCNGALHEFHFQTRLLGHIVSLEAFELKDGDPGGYKFQLVADPEDDLFALLASLIERIRRALAVKHITNDDQTGPQIADQTVLGRIEWDEEQDGRVPLVVIDGQSYTWEEFGEMLMAFEGSPFRFELSDPSEEP